MPPVFAALQADSLPLHHQGNPTRRQGGSSFMHLLVRRVRCWFKGSCPVLKCQFFLKNALFLYHSLHRFFFCLFVFNSIIHVEKSFSVEHCPVYKSALVFSKGLNSNYVRGSVNHVSPAVWHTITIDNSRWRVWPVLVKLEAGFHRRLQSADP